MTKYLLALFVLVQALAIAQNSTNGPASPYTNDPVTPVVVGQVAVYNASGTALTVATNANTGAVPFIVTSVETNGSGSTAWIASNGLATCVMDSNYSVGTGGLTYVILSPGAAPKCHAQSTLPTSGSGLVGYLAAASTSTGVAANVQVNPSIVTATSSPGGACGGDTGGTYPNCTVVNLSNVTNSSLANTGLAHPSLTLNGQTVALGASGNIPFQVNGTPNTSLAGVNVLTSTANAAGLTVTPSNPGTNQERFEITGTAPNFASVEFTGPGNVTINNAIYPDAFTTDISNLSTGKDVRGYGATLSGTGVTGGGTDDSVAICTALGAYGWAYIPNITPGATTHVRWASPCILPGTDTCRRLSCAGSNNDGRSPGLVSIDIDMGGQTSGPAILEGIVTSSAFQGITIDKSCSFNDISTSKNSPGGVALVNSSNHNLSAAMSHLTLPVMATATVAASTSTTSSPMLSCITTGGTIHYNALIYEQMSALGPGFGPGAVSAEVSELPSADGCTGSSTTCSCSPTAPSVISTTASAVQVWWGTTSGGEAALGLPYVCSAGTCAMTQNFTYGATPTSATKATSVPTTGRGPNLLDHSGAYGYLATGTGASNCGLHGDTCGASTYSNQPRFLNVDCYEDNNCFDFVANVASPQISVWHNDTGSSGGVHAATIETEAHISNFHLEGSGAGPWMQLAGTGGVLENGLLESGASVTGISGTSLSGWNFDGVLCGNVNLTTCYTEDSNSGPNRWAGNAI